MFKSKRTAFALVGALSLMLVLLLVACAAAPTITVAPASVAQNGNVTVTGANFQNAEVATITIGNVTLGKATASSTGAFTASLKVPTDVKAGAATVTAKGDKGASPAGVALTVTAAPK